jgi:hypothetical protein
MNWSSGKSSFLLLHFYAFYDNMNIRFGRAIIIIHPYAPDIGLEHTSKGAKIYLFAEPVSNG